MPYFPNLGHIYGGYTGIFYERCLYELIIAQFTPHNSKLLESVILAVKKGRFTPRVVTPKTINRNNIWRGGQIHSHKSGRGDDKSQQNKPILFSFVGICVCIVCSVLISTLRERTNFTSH